MRRLFTTADAASFGITPNALRHGQRTGRWRRVERGVYAVGGEAAAPLDRARASALACDGAARCRFAGALFGLDGVVLGGPELLVSPTANGRRQGARRCVTDPARIVTVHQVRCTDGLQTLVDLAAVLDDLVWEQALESALRKRLLTIDSLQPFAGGRSAASKRIRTVLALRPPDAPPTESMLETLFVQLARLVPGLPPPRRQVEVYDQHDRFVARVDFAWPELGLFIELDGEHHRDQPLYDASRETAVVAATGWLCGRFTWTEVARYPTPTAGRLAALVEQARRRPLPAS